MTKANPSVAAGVALRAALPTPEYVPAFDERLRTRSGQIVMRAFDAITDDRATWQRILLRGRRAWEGAQWLHRAMRARGINDAHTLRAVACLLSEPIVNSKGLFGGPG